MAGKKGSALLIGVIVLSILAVGGVVSYFTYLKPRAPIEGTPGWNFVYSGYDSDSWICPLMPDYPESKCMVRVYEYCTEHTCEWDCFPSGHTHEQCKPGGYYTSGSECRYRNIYGCPSYIYTTVPPGLATESHTVGSVQEQFHAFNHSSEWFEIRPNTLVEAPGKLIEYEIYGYYNCHLAGLYYPNETKCGKDIYPNNPTYADYLYQMLDQWDDSSGTRVAGQDGCGESAQLVQNCKALGSGVICEEGVCKYPTQPGCESHMDLGKIECINDNTAQRECVNVSGYYQWKVTNCLSAETCEPGLGCGCEGVQNPCPIGMEEFYYKCTHSSGEKAYQRCVNIGGCKQLGTVSYCSAGVCTLNVGEYSLENPCGCEPHVLDGKSCDLNSIGDEMCMSISTGQDVIYECIKDNATGCAKWNKDETCAIEQSCELVVSYGSLLDWECGCPGNMCAQDDSGCVDSTTSWYCQIIGTASCGQRVSVPCEGGFKCQDGMCRCVDECPSVGSVGCAPEIGSDGSTDYYSATCHEKQVYDQVTGRYTTCKYWVPNEQFTCEEQGKYCDMESYSNTFGQCLDPFKVTWSSPTNFKYSRDGDLEITLALSNPRGGVNLARAQINFVVLKDKESQNVLANCDWRIAGTTQKVTCKTSLSGLSDGQYVVKAVVQEGWDYGPFYHTITVGNTVNIYLPAEVETVQYSNDEISFWVEMQYPSGSVLQSSDVVDWQIKRYTIDGAIRQLPYPVYKSGKWEFTFYEGRVGQLEIELLPILKSSEYVVEKFTTSEIRIDKPKLQIKMLEPTSFPKRITQDDKVEFRWACEKPGLEGGRVTCTTKAVVYDPEGISTDVTHLIVPISNSEYTLTYQFPETPSYHVLITGTATSYEDGMSCPEYTTGGGGTYRGCPIDVSKRGEDYTNYIIAAVILVVVILFFALFKAGGKKKGRKRK